MAGNASLGQSGQSAVLNGLNTNIAKAYLSGSNVLSPVSNTLACTFTYSWDSQSEEGTLTLDQSSLIFSLDAGDTVSHLVIVDSSATVVIMEITFTSETFTNDGTFTVTDITIQVT